MALKDEIETRGPKADADVATLALIFGKQMTPSATIMIFCYRQMEYAQHQSTEHGETPGPEQGEYQKLILKALELEIKRQRMESQLQSDLDQLEYKLDMPILPPDDICERIQRYRTANDRKVSRSLANLETIRRLKGKT